MLFFHLIKFYIMDKFCDDSMQSQNIIETDHSIHWFLSKALQRYSKCSYKDWIHSCGFDHQYLNLLALPSYRIWKIALLHLERKHTHMYAVIWLTFDFAGWLVGNWINFLRDIQQDSLQENTTWYKPNSVPPLRISCSFGASTWLERQDSFNLIDSAATNKNLKSPFHLYH